MLNTLDEQIKILIVDDDAVDRMALKRALKSTDFAVTISEAGDADSALSQITAGQYSCIFLDYNQKVGFLPIRSLASFAAPSACTGPKKL